MSYNLSLLNNEIVEIDLQGDQNDQETFAMMKESLIYNQQLSAQRKPVKVLVNLTEVPHVDPEAMKKVFQGVKSIAFDKLALYGANDQVSEQTQPMTSMDTAGKLQRFLTREEALEWLRK